MDTETQEYCSMLRRDPCSYCGKTDAIVIDHIVPVEKGGKDHWSNFTASCARCNASKGAKNLVDFTIRKPIGGVVHPNTTKKCGHKLTVYVPSTIWNRFDALRDQMTYAELGEKGNISKIMQAALTVAADELERAKGEKR